MTPTAQLISDKEAFVRARRYTIRTKSPVNGDIIVTLTNGENTFEGKYSEVRGHSLTEAQKYANALNVAVEKLASFEGRFGTN
jgi:hypothetical protein